MKLTEKQAFKVFDKICNWLGIEYIINQEGSTIGQITQDERADFVMQELINLEI